MVLETDFDPDVVVRDLWPGATRYPIWGGLGYCLVYSDTRSDSDSDSRIDIPIRRNPA